jgi:hypothetical protein
MLFSLSFSASSDGVRWYSTDFSYISLAEPHLGGDDFNISSVRIDHGTGRSEIAKVTAFGRILSLEYNDVTSRKAPPLPVVKPEPRTPAGAPPVVVEGRGPVGVAARGKSISSIDVRQNEPSDPTAMSVDAAWANFDMAIRELVGPKIQNGEKGVYVQLRALETRSSSPSALKLRLGEVNRDPYLSDLFGAPFAFIPIGDVANFEDLHPAIRLKAGESRLLNFLGRSFVVTRYDLQ